MAPAVVPACITILLRKEESQPKKEKEAERRQTLITILRALRRGSREASRARLSAFHHGSCQRDSRIP